LQKFLLEQLMDFTSLPFLFLFLPVLIAIILLAEARFRPAILLAASLLFLAWGRPSALAVFALLVGGNYFFGLWIGQSPASKRRLFLGVAFNLSLLVFYKFFTAYRQVWFVTTFERVLPDALETDLLHLVYPIGLSYVALQMIAYLVDIVRAVTPAEKNAIHFASYVTLLPKLLTGPIVPYRSVRDDLAAPAPTLSNVADGLRRFALGLTKKVLIADQLARITAPVFRLSEPNVTPHIAWLALTAFAVQIYYDFSGYTDMAIGLGRALGFTFPKNFNFPFLARSLGDFWRRWHMTLSTWFREYVFYPLERRRLPFLGQRFNILLVFLLTGLWHGLTPGYAAWGLIMGAALALESTAFGRWLKNTWRPLQHIYTLGIFSFALIFFRSPSLAFAFGFLGRLAGNATGLTPLPFSMTRPLPFIDPTTWLALGFGILFLFPLASILDPLRARAIERFPRLGLFLRLLADAFLLLLFWAGIAVIVSGSFAPGIYDKF
jgi:alginate O-acetyltransferase complex protein AlgI